MSGLLLASAVLAGCSGDGAEDGADDGAAGGDPSAGAGADAAGSSSTPVPELPEGVELTEQGTELALGESAEVVWSPREGTTGVLDLTVEEVREVSLDEFSAFRISEAVRRSTPYFVTARIENIGETPLGGVGVPLYLLDDSDTLVERSTFGSSFEACPSEPLPGRFRPGARTTACLVFLAPRRGEAEAVSFRPSEDVEPITWVGEITGPGGQGGQGGQDGGQNGGQGGGQNGGQNGGGRG
ncbi:hypothetical protein GCM10009737_34550 [Nocardioides lentus]|uniref:DUF4352 domain-containing protein n=1 Tax=Nocardioides lentus TaxID=338077 RepID=A0ABN2PR88_9ACTN